ncbi:caspase-3-like isoform X2 [Mytilus trossulus]
MASNDYEWKNAFKKNRVMIVKGLANPVEVADQLYRMNIFTEDMRDEITQTSETEPKTRLILDTLDRRGQKGVAALHRAFLDTKNTYLAEGLSPYVRAVEKIENMTEPKEWPPKIEENSTMMDDHVIKIMDKKSPWYIHEYGKEDVYKIQNDYRGKVFVINNVDFDGQLLHREASNKDADNLTKLFTELHFTVIHKTDLTAQEMLSFLRSEAKELVKEDRAECVILIIMSHGVGTKVYGVDCLPVEIKALTDCFSTANCQVLQGKPRLVFVQACRSVEAASIEKTLHLVQSGKQVEMECIVKIDKPIKQVFWEMNKAGAKYRITEAVNQDKYSLQSSKIVQTLIIKKVVESDQGKYRCLVKHDEKVFSASNFTELKLDVKDGARDVIDSVPSVQETENCVLPTSTFPDHPSADFLIAYATPEGTIAWLNEDVGSWFMSAIVWTFKYHAHKEELHHLLIRVNRLVGKDGNFKKKEMTVAEVKSNLRKKFFFFPGIHNDPPELF